MSRQGQLLYAPFTVGSDAVKPVRCVRYLPVSGYLSGFRRIYENSCLEDDRQLFHLAVSDQKYSTLSKQTSTLVTGHVTNSVKARLRQCHTRGVPAYLID